MSVEYIGHVLCAAAPTERKAYVSVLNAPHLRLSPVRIRLRRPPAARRTTPPPFPRRPSRWRRRKFHRRKIRRRKFMTFQKILYLAVRHYIWTIRRTFLDCSLWLSHPPRDSFKLAAGHTLPLDPREKRKR